MPVNHSDFTGLQRTVPSQAAASVVLRTRWPVTSIGAMDRGAVTGGMWGAAWMACILAQRD
ncbi:MAG: hypothetical protein EOO54_23005 [Haliea sp.]|nr:MAG: hypothetical protein EOO54_23005 [Haliea sp.]